jgi:hypothetical protein
MVFEELSVDELDDEAGLLMNAFFTQSEPSKAAGRAYIERLKLGAENRDAAVSKQLAWTPTSKITNISPLTSNSSWRLSKAMLRHPVFPASTPPIPFSSSASFACRFSDVRLRLVLACGRGRQDRKV